MVWQFWLSRVWNGTYGVKVEKYLPSGGSREESVSLPFQLPEAAHTPWLVASFCLQSQHSHHSHLCLCYHISDSHSPASLLQWPLWLHLTHQDNSRWSLHLQMLDLVTSAKFLLPCKGAYSQALIVGQEMEGWTGQVCSQGPQVLRVEKLGRRMNDLEANKNKIRTCSRPWKK